MGKNKLSEGLRSIQHSSDEITEHVTTILGAVTGIAVGIVKLAGGLVTVAVTAPTTLVAAGANKFATRIETAPEVTPVPEITAVPYKDQVAGEGPEAMPAIG